jgi:hypothetical protein
MAGLGSGLVHPVLSASNVGFRRIATLPFCIGAGRSGQESLHPYHGRYLLLRRRLHHGQISKRSEA